MLVKLTTGIKWEVFQWSKPVVSDKISSRATLVARTVISNTIAIGVIGVLGCS